MTEVLSDFKPVKYFEDFDALRGVAALLVVCYHIPKWLQWPNNIFYESLEKIISFNNAGGEFGVTFFFVLSGFLITYLMLRERAGNGSFNIWKFYGRRFLRIWPLYFLTLLIGFVLYPLLAQIMGRSYLEKADWVYYVFFMANFNGLSNGYSLGVLGVQWSVAIEEQFYLFWPILFLLFTRFRFLGVILFLVILSNLFIFQNIDDPKLIYFHTIPIINDLSIGALASFISFYWPNYLEKILHKIPRLLIIFIYCCGFLFIFFSKEMIGLFPIVMYFKKFVIALFFAFILLEQTYGIQSFIKMRKCKFLSYLGKISYGIYLLHMAAIQSVLGVSSFIFIPISVQILLVLSLTILISHLSYHYFESFFLKFKYKFDAK